MRVTHVLFDFDGGGLESLVGAMARYWHGSDVSMSVVTLGGRPGREGSAVREVLDQFHVLRPARGLSMALPLSVVRALRATRPDVVHLHSGAWLKPAWAARLAGIPAVVYTEHGREHSDSPAARWLDRQAARLTDMVVTVSERLRGYMERELRIPSSRLRTIVNGVDTDRFTPAPAASPLRRQLGIPADAWVIGSVGRLETVKAYPRLVAAAARVRAAVPARPVHLVICGEGAERSAIAAAAATAGLSAQVHLPGWISDPVDWYRLFDVFALSSDSEGLSVSLLEAMASGCAPAVTDVGANAQVLGTALRAQVVPPGDEVALATAIGAALAAGGRAGPLGAAARERVRATYSLERMLREHEDLYRSLAARTRSRS